MRPAFFLVLTLFIASAAPGQTPPPSPTPDPNSPAGKELTESRQVIVAAYAPLAQKYSEVHMAMKDAGGASTAGLNTKEDIAARKTLIAACIAANEDMLKFLATEPDILRVELAKVSMSPSKIEEYVSNFTPDPATAQLVQIRTLARQTFKDMTDSLTALEDSFGHWTLGANGRITFKKGSEMKKYSVAVDRMLKSITAQTAAQAQLKANELESPAAAAESPAPAPAPAPTPAS